MKILKSTNEDGDYAEIDADVLRSTDKAILVSDGETAKWLPKSQCLEIDAKAGKIVIPEWLARDKGFV